MTPQQYLARLHNSFEFFLAELWKSVGLPQPSLHQRDMARWLQSGPKRRGIRAFRGGSKTWVATAYCLWRLFRNANERITIVSKSEGHGKKTLHMARQWLKTVPFLAHLTPSKQAGQRDAATMFDVAGSKHDRTPSFSAYGITGQVTGARSTIILADDIETPENTLTVEMRKRLRDQAVEFDNVIVPGGDVIYLGTPHHEETIYDHLPTIGYQFRTWPARYPGNDDKVPDLSPVLRQRLENGMNQPGDPVWPQYMTHEELLAKEATGRRNWLMQYMMVSGLDDTLRYPLKLRDLIVFAVPRDKAPATIAWGTTGPRGSTRIEDIDCYGFSTDALYGPIFYDENFAPYTGTKMWIDPSGRGDDKTAYAIVAQLNGILWVKACAGLTGGYDEQTLETLATMARLNDAREIIVEDNFGQGMFAALFQPVVTRHFAEPGENPACPSGWKASVETRRVHGQKEVRIIEALEPVMSSHRLVVDRSVASNQSLQEQLTRITRQRGALAHEDELDALASCVKEWGEVIGVDPQKAHERHRHRRMQQLLREHMALTGTASPSPRWHRHH